MTVSAPGSPQYCSCQHPAASPQIMEETMSRKQISTPSLTRRSIFGSAAAAVVAVAVEAPAHAETTAFGGGLNQDAIDAVAAEFEEAVIALRRDIHANPEGPGDEDDTAALVAERLTAAGLAVTTGVGGHGVVGVLKGRRPGRTVAYRADMDAVPAHDQIGGGTAPEHLCGHDLHTAIGVGVAQTLARLRHRLSGTIVFVFQPAEESLKGAQAMLDDKEKFDINAFEEIHALHCGPFPLGEFGVNAGTGLPGQDRGTVVVTGPDAKTRAARLAADINGLATVATPGGSADLEVIVGDLQIEDGPLAEFTTIRARVGDAATEERADIELSYRCWPEERYTEVREEIERLAEPYGEAAVDFPRPPFPAMIIPEDQGRDLERQLRRAMGRNSATALHASIPFSGEDFALFLDRIPGTWTYLGVRSPGADITTSYPHFGVFDPDEAALGLGVRAMAGWLAERARC
jgi:amidohydrolase